MVVAECNMKYNGELDGKHDCIIHWDKTYSLSTLANYVTSVEHYSGGSTGGATKPQGVIDYFAGGEGCIGINGWAFDMDDPSKSLDIHVYIGGPAGSGSGEGHQIKADKYRDDVNTVYGVGNYHGISSTIETNMTGSQTVYVYAIDAGTTWVGNVLIGSATVNITPKPNDCSTGHSWGTPTYKWSSDNKTCTATRVCSRDSSHTETETVNAVSSTVTEAGCESSGKIKYTATFSNSAFTTQTKTVTMSSTGHSWGTPTYKWSSDNKTCTATRTCTNDSSHKETETVNAVTTTVTSAGCESSGKVKYTATFSNSAFTTQTKTVTVSSTGHSWGTPTYKWSSDNKTCTATRTCTNDSSHKETETVNAVNVTVTSAGCESSGKVKYTATFSNSAFTTQTKTVTVPSTGHSWGTPTYKWSSDNKTCTATRVCANDSSHKETETVNTTSQVIKQPTTAETGTRKFTATFTNSAFTTQTKNVSIPKLDEPVDDDIYFPDVKEGAWYYDAVQYVAKAGFMSGYQNGYFGPGDNLKRQDFVVIIANIAKADLSKYAGKASSFKDVQKGSYYAAAVNWAVANNIVSGYNSTKFGVNDPITREQIATILYKYKKEPAVGSITSTLAKFSDGNNVSLYATTPMAWAVQKNVISGMSDGRLAPTKTASRAEIASIIQRMDQQGLFK